MGLIKKYLDYRKQREINIDRINNTDKEEVKELLYRKSLSEIIDFEENTQLNSYIITNSEYAVWDKNYKYVELASNYITKEVVLDLELHFADGIDRDKPNIKINKKVYMLNQVVSYEIREKSFLLKFNDSSSLWLGSDNDEEFKFIKKVIYSLPI